MSDMKGLKKDMGEHSTRASLYGLLPTGLRGERFLHKLSSRRK